VLDVRLDDAWYPAMAMGPLSTDGHAPIMLEGVMQDSSCLATASSYQCYMLCAATMDILMVPKAQVRPGQQYVPDGAGQQWQDRPLCLGCLGTAVHLVSAGNGFGDGLASLIAGCAVKEYISPLLQAVSSRFACQVPGAHMWGCAHQDQYHAMLQRTRHLLAERHACM
jgi:hypothetical protein